VAAGLSRSTKGKGMLGAVIFDFDGVIVDDEGLHLAGFRHALLSLGMEISDEDYYQRYVGYDDRDGFTVIFRDRGVSLDEEALLGLMADKAAEFERLAAGGARLFDGVEELISALAEAGVPLAIGSGALGNEIRMVLAQSGLADRFEVIVSAEDVSAGKPDPETYDRARRLLQKGAGREAGAGIAAENCVVIEDTTAGLASARSAGMHTLAVTNTFAAASLDADLVVDSLADVSVETLRGLLDRAGDKGRG